MSRLAIWTGGDYSRECSQEYLDEAAVPALIVFPNPATHHFYINVADPRAVRMYDACGKLVKAVADETIEKGIDISALACGIYFVRIQTGASNLVTRLLKM